MSDAWKILDAELTRKYYRENKALVLKKKKEYYQKNKEEIKRKANERYKKRKNKNG